MNLLQLVKNVWIVDNNNNYRKRTSFIFPAGNTLLKGINIQPNDSLYLSHATLLGLMYKNTGDIRPYISCFFYFLLIIGEFCFLAC